MIRTRSSQRVEATAGGILAYGGATSVRRMADNNIGIACLPDGTGYRRAYDG